MHDTVFYCKLKGTLMTIDKSNRMRILIEMLITCAGECQRLYMMVLEYCLPEIAESYNQKKRELQSLKKLIFEETEVMHNETL